MAIPSMSSEQMRAAVTELDQALYNHEQWSETLYATLACHLPPDERDLAEGAHRKCRFGQWYYGTGAVTFGAHPGFAEIEQEHQRMHRFAAQLLQLSAKGETTSVQNYEHFVSALKRLRLEVETLKRELEETLYNLDPLTGTPGRIGMLTKLREEQELVRRKLHRCAIAMMDLDHFKAINDYYGHVAGDKVLIAFARHLTAGLRPYDKVFRYGGEEFLVVLPDTELPVAENILERLRKELEEMPHEGDGKGVFHVTVSFGVTLIEPDIPVEQSIDRADKALYLAKLGGRNRTMIWDAEARAAAAQ
jgi:diguanylate cyclase